MTHHRDVLPRVALGLVAAVTLATACDFSVTNPGPVEDKYLSDPTARPALVTGMRRALLDFASLRYPAWDERNTADVGVMLVEAMAALGDEMAYYQDRVAREATLETATQRRSVRRHARLVGDGPTAWREERARARGGAGGGRRRALAVAARRRGTRAAAERSDPRRAALSDLAGRRRPTRRLLPAGLPGGGGHRGLLPLPLLLPPPSLLLLSLLLSPFRQHFERALSVGAGAVLA